MGTPMNTAALTISAGALVLSLLTVVYAVRLRRRCRALDEAAAGWMTAAFLAQEELASVNEHLLEHFGGPVPTDPISPTGLDLLDPAPRRRPAPRDGQ